VSFLAQNSEFLHTLKEALKSAGWSVKGSSDGGGGGAPVGDNIDRWTDGAGFTDVVWDTPGNNFSWIVLESPSGYPSAGKNVWLTISCEYAAGTEYQARFHWATAIPTGGSATAAPTQGANSRSYANRQVFRNPLANSKYHIHYNTDGDFLAFVSEDGSGYCAFVLCSLEAVNGDTGALYPWIGLCNYTDLDPGGMTEDAWRTNTEGVCFWQDDSPIPSTNQMGILQPTISTTSFRTDMDSNGSDISTEYFDIPCIVVTRNTGEVGVLGTLPDVSWAPSGLGVVQGTEAPTGTSDRCIVGDHWVPNGGITPSF
jgi:hypothetical protein